MQNSYPMNATVGREIVIITSVTNICLADYNQVIVNILLPNTSIILSTAPASPAINEVRAPEIGGPWSVVVQAVFIIYPLGGTIGLFQDTITIHVYKI
jgi:hypothetical protein